MFTEVVVKADRAGAGVGELSDLEKTVDVSLKTDIQIDSIWKRSRTPPVTIPMGTRPAIS